jgi:hypothetical protein
MPRKVTNFRLDRKYVENQDSEYIFSHTDLIFLAYQLGILSVSLWEEEKPV